MAWIPGQSQTSKASPVQLFYMYSSRPASTWRSVDGRASCAVSVWKSEDGKRWNDLYSAYNASTSSEKTSCLYAYGFFSFLFLRVTCARAIPAPYLRPRHTCARAFYHKPTKGLDKHSTDVRLLYASVWAWVLGRCWSMTWEHTWRFIPISLGSPRGGG